MIKSFYKIFLLSVTFLAIPQKALAALPCSFDTPAFPELSIFRLAITSLIILSLLIFFIIKVLHWKKHIKIVTLLILAIVLWFSSSYMLNAYNKSYNSPKIFYTCEKDNHVITDPFPSCRGCQLVCQSPQRLKCLENYKKENEKINKEIETLNEEKRSKEKIEKEIENMFFNKYIK